MNNITDVNIACDAVLNKDISQEIGFINEENFKAKMEHDEYIDQLEREWYGIYEVCNGTGSYWDCGPHNSRREFCDNCNGTGFIKDQDA